MAGVVTVTATPDGATVTEQAADRTGPGAVDRILIMPDGSTAALLLPHEPRGRFADRLGLPRGARLGFTTTVPGDGEIRVFALSGEAAAELRR